MIINTLSQRMKSKEQKQNVHEDIRDILIGTHLHTGDLIMSLDLIFALTYHHLLLLQHIHFHQLRYLK